MNKEYKKINFLAGSSIEENVEKLLFYKKMEYWLMESLMESHCIRIR